MIDTIKDSVKEFGALDAVLVAFCGFLIWKLVLAKFFVREKLPVAPPPLPPMKRKDMTVEELIEYDGEVRPDKRVCIAIGGKIFDVTRRKDLYGKEGPYGIFAGRDASRGLGKFSTEKSSIRDTYDDLSDLTPDELDGMREWAAQFSEKYQIVGRLLKPGELPESYSDDESEASASQSSGDKKSE